jgi:tetratricopeptide (TPR) repeat protein
VRLVFGEHDCPAGQVYQPGRDPGHHVAMVWVAAGGQFRPPAAARSARPEFTGPRYLRAMAGTSGEMADRPPALHRTILCVDVEGFGDTQRTNSDQLAVREGLYECLHAAFAGSNISWAACYYEDRGDGAFFLIPPDIPKQSLVTLFLRELSAALYSHNKSRTVRRRIRARLALHAGEVHRDTYGVAGTAINLAFRLLDAEALRQALASSSGTLAVIVSQWFFDEVVRHIPASNPSSYRRVLVSVKETETAGWICRPDDPYSSSESAELLPLPRATVPRQLPVALSSFSDRERELQALTNPLEQRAEPGAAAVISVVQGTAGIGKSALAVNWAHRVVDRFPDGQLYVNLRGFEPAGSPLTPAHAVRNFLDAFAVPAERIPVSLDAQAALYRSLLAGRRVLIVLDNARDADQVRPLLPGSPGCAVVVTSRSQLTSLVTAEGANLIPLGFPTTAQARQLLAQRVGANRVAAEPQAAADITTLCARLPLALAIVAARAAANPTFSLAALARELANAQGSLAAFEGIDATVDTRAVFSSSYHQLTGPAAMMFRLLGLHLGPDIAAPAAASLAGVSPAQARLLLNELTRTHLLNERVPGRFAFHDLLRAYASERCQAEESSEQRTQAAGRLVSWYLTTADAADRLLAPFRRHVRIDAADVAITPLTFQDYDATLAWCEAERDNLVATVQLAAGTSHHEQAWKLAMALVTFFHLKKYRTDRLTTAIIALDSARQIDDKWGEAWSTLSIGSTQRDLSHPDDAITYYRQALDEWRRIGDDYGQAMTLNNLSEAYRDMRQFDNSLECAEGALPFWRKINDRRNEAITLTGMAMTCNALGRFREAIPYLERALHMSHETDRHTEGISLHAIGTSLLQLGQLTEAAERFYDALRCQREIGDRYGEAETLRDLAELQKQLRDITGARHSLGLAISIFSDLEDPQLAAAKTEMERLQNYN